jgi:hypothetical protein
MGNDEIRRLEMSNLQDQFKINLNQNLWGLVAGLGALGIAEYYKLRTLYWFAFVVATIMTLSILATTIAYTINYCKNKH